MPDDVPPSPAPTPDVSGNLASNEPSPTNEGGSPDKEKNPPDAKDEEKSGNGKGRSDEEFAKAKAGEQPNEVISDYQFELVVSPDETSQTIKQSVTYENTKTGVKRTETFKVTEPYEKEKGSGKGGGGGEKENDGEEKNDEDEKDKENSVPEGPEGPKGLDEETKKELGDVASLLEKNGVQAGSDGFDGAPQVENAGRETPQGQER